MRKLGLVVAVGYFVIGCGDCKIAGEKHLVLAEVKSVNAPIPISEARIKALEARVEHLEGWATKKGGGMK